ncbi:hypothetical protein NGM37_26915, partial [Streptomyces sp. TRM76130]|nr:hypothetical protein [Streptomyces sp. TRM76130]
TVDLAAMSLLTAVSAGPGHPAHTGHPAAGPGVWLPLFFLACWAVARTGALLLTRVWCRSRTVPTGPDSRRPRPCTVFLRESGSLAMITSMAAMLG